MSRVSFSARPESMLTADAPRKKRASSEKLAPEGYREARLLTREQQQRLASRSVFTKDGYDVLLMQAKKL
jgi:hypothetical protein